MWILVLLVFGAIFLPALWVKHALKKHQGEIVDLPGTGGEFAEHLINKLELEDVTLEQTSEFSDHYDPVSKTVRLGPGNLEGKSLTAVAVAAHEVGHAIQHQQNYAPLQLRGKLVHIAAASDRLAALLIIMAPIVMAITKNPRLMLLFAAAGIIAALLRTVMHIITLPVEFDASFGKALPILEQGNYLKPQELRICRRILLACALTYVSQSLTSLLQLHRWISLIRR